MSLYVVDVEADGPIPGKYSMVSFGAVLVEPGLGRTFHGKTRPISEAFLPEARILFLTSYADNRFVLAAMEAGADGYLLKESGVERILAAIHSIVRGGTVFDPVIARGVLGGSRRVGEGNPLAGLNGRENRILAEVAKGKTDKEVAAALGLTPKAVRNNLDGIFGKLKIHTRTEAALLYTRFSEKLPPWE